jgi:WD repeat and SOCS box-containing protein 1
MKIDEEIDQNALQYKGCIIDDTTASYDYKRVDITKCKCSQDGQFLAWSNSENHVKLLNLGKQDSLDNYHNFDLHTRDCSNDALKSIVCPEEVTAIAFGTSKSNYNFKHHLNRRTSTVNKRFHLEGLMLLAVGLQSGKIYIYNASNCLFLFALCDHRDAIRDLKFTNEGSFQLASASKDCTIKLWDMFDDGNMYRTLSQHSSCVNSCDWSPSAPLLCSVGTNREVYVWSTSGYTVRHALRGHMHDVVSCEFSCDGGLLATASFDTRIAIWDPYTGELLRSF